MSQNSEAYGLPHDEAEYQRLKTQHEIWQETFGFVIHPSQKHRLGSNARIADIGTGTGHWLEAAVDALPSTCSFDGFDINIDSVVRSRLSSRIQTHVFDARQPFPAEYHGKFDMVHVRLLVLGFEVRLWPEVTKNLVQLLKPGGFLQWAEPKIDVNHAYLGAPTSSASSLTRSMSLWCDLIVHRFGADIEKLHDAFVEAGLDTQCYYFSNDRIPANRAASTRVTSEGVFAALRKTATAAPEKFPLTIDELGELHVNIEKDIESGAYVRFDIHVNVGVKASCDA